MSTHLDARLRASSSLPLGASGRGISHFTSPPLYRTTSGKTPTGLPAAPPHLVADSQKSSAPATSRCKVSTSPAPCHSDRPSSQSSPNRTTSYPPPACPDPSTDGCYPDD